MPRYFFDIREGEHLVVDNEGLWFPDFVSAEQEAAEAAACILRDMPRKGGKRMQVTIEVRDENRRRIIAASAAIHIVHSLEG